MKIAVLGTGCPKCIKTEEVVRRFVEENNVDAEIIKVKDINEIMKYNVMMTPAVAVNGRVVAEGKVPGDTELKKMLGT